ncbi:MAG: hypothetical protein IJ092_02750 [Atopobiaceae bacterium]|nr:hypothetical protein [Atopobiaceae bacterium]MBR1829008.1 hypothetical protein [Atopobiaceae bacterium]
MQEDIRGVSTLMLIFGLVLLAYGALIYTTGNKDLLPMRAQHSVRTKDDVRVVGKYTAIVGAIIATLAGVAFLLGT